MLSRRDEFVFSVAPQLLTTVMIAAFSISKLMVHRRFLTAELFVLSDCDYACCVSFPVDDVSLTAFSCCSGHDCVRLVFDDVPQ